MVSCAKIEKFGEVVMIRYVGTLACLDIGKMKQCCVRRVNELNLENKGR